MRGLLWCLYAVAAVSGATITKTTTSRVSTTVTTTKLSTVTLTVRAPAATVTVKAPASTVTVKASASTVTLNVKAPASTVTLNVRGAASVVTVTSKAASTVTVTSKAVSTVTVTSKAVSSVTVTSKAVSTVTITTKAVSTLTVKSGVTVTSTQLSTATALASTVYVTLQASTLSVTTTSIGTISRTTTLPASTITLPVATTTLPASISYVTLSASTTTLPASISYVTLSASTTTLPASISYVTLSASTTTLPASISYVTLSASTTTLPASISYVTLSASTTTLPAITTTLSASYVTLSASTVTIPASTVLSTVTAPISYSTALSTIVSTLPASTIYVTTTAFGGGFSNSTSSTFSISGTSSSTSSDSATSSSSGTSSSTSSGSVTSSSSGTSSSTSSGSVTSSISGTSSSTSSGSATSSSSGTSSSTSSGSATSSISGTSSSTSSGSITSSISGTSSSTSSGSATSSISSTSSSTSSGSATSSISSTSSSTSSGSATSSTSSTSTSSTRPITRTATAAPATTPSGTVSTCYQWHIANSWDTCVLLEGEFGISAANLLAWNPSINSACSNIIAGDAYCVDGSGNLFTSPTATASSAVVTGIISPCYRYHTITSGDYCSLLQLEFGISFDVLRAWNPSINNDCNNLVVGDSYCMDGAGHNALPSKASPSTPTSAGTTTTCYQYHIITSSDTCTSIQAASGLTFDLLRVWNTQINNGCTNLQTGYSLCVDGSGLFTSVSTGSSSSTTSTSASVTATSSGATSSGTTSSGTASTGKPVFAHYMVGSMTSAEAVIDIQQAQAMGVDAFALNVDTATASWSTNAVAALFAAAQTAGFKLFFSFDMSQFSAPSDFIPLLTAYVTNSAYYKYNNLPFVSTFNGGNGYFGYSSPNVGWQKAYKDVMSAAGISTYFVPDFADSYVSPSNMYSNFPVADGLFNWEGSWPTVAQGKVNVSSTDDAAYITAAKTAGKTFMMGISALQFKHLSSANYVRRGGLNLALRISQILTLAPDFVEIQTWNDAGEGHYIGPIWSEGIAGSTIGTYTTGYDHSGWQILMTPMLNAYKAGYTSISNVVPTGSATVQGVFWHNTLLSTASCSGDSLGKPSGSENLDDSIAVAVLVAKGITGLTVNVYSGGTKLGSYATAQGLNAFEVFGMGVGAVKVEVVSSSGSTILSATGSIAVQADSSNCNYNPQVVALS